MKTFFTALGHHFLQKHANRLPWPMIVHALREDQLMPAFIPRIPFIEPEPLPPIEMLPPPAPASEPLPEKKEEEKSAPESPPKRKPEDGAPPD